MSNSRPTQEQLREAFPGLNEAIRVIPDLPEHQGIVHYGFWRGEQYPAEEPYPDDADYAHIAIIPRMHSEIGYVAVVRNPTLVLTESGNVREDAYAQGEGPMSLGNFFPAADIRHSHRAKRGVRPNFARDGGGRIQIVTALLPADLEKTGGAVAVLANWILLRSD